MPNSKEQVTNFIEALEDTYLGDVKPYSGRGMFGKECVSITSDDELSAWSVARELFSERPDYNIPAPQQDSLGLGIVLYWPSFEWPKEEVNA